MVPVQIMNGAVRSEVDLNDVPEKQDTLFEFGAQPIDTMMNFALRFFSIF